MNKDVGRTKTKGANFQHSSGKPGRTHQNQAMQNDLTTSMGKVKCRDQLENLDVGKSVNSEMARKETDLH
jgi:hypothetical protein